MGLERHQKRKASFSLRAKQGRLPRPLSDRSWGFPHNKARRAQLKLALAQGRNCGSSSTLLPLIRQHSVSGILARPIRFGVSEVMQGQEGCSCH
jgi:hypothetical protein